MFGLAPHFYTDVETFGWNWGENDIKDIKNDAKTSTSAYWRHARVVVYSFM